MDNKELIDELIAKAMTNKHSKFTLLRSTAEYKVAKIFCKATKKIVHAFKEMAKANELAVKNPVKYQVAAERLPALQTGISLFKSCAKFYQDEIDLVKQEMREFRIYMDHCPGFGKMLGILLLGNERPVEDLLDYRK